MNLLSLHKRLLFVLLVFLMLSCSKEDEINTREYLTDGYISYNLIYKSPTKTTEFSGTMYYYDSYYKSSVWSNTNSKTVLITRYSKDLLNLIQLDFVIDSTNSHAEPGMFGISFEITTIDKDGLLETYMNTVIFGGYTIPEKILKEVHRFDNVIYNSSTRHIMGSFYYESYYEPSNGETFVLNGDFDIQLYEFMN